MGGAPLPPPSRALEGARSAGLTPGDVTYALKDRMDRWLGETEGAGLGESRSVPRRGPPVREGLTLLPPPRRPPTLPPSPASLTDEPGEKTEGRLPAI